MSLKDVELKHEYRSLSQNVIGEFYTPVLKESILYKRAVGFFSSSALLELSAGICGLIENGGRIELIASPKLSQEDIQAINDGIKRRDKVIEDVLLRDLQDIQGKFDEIRLNLLSNLIAAGRLEIKIAFLEANNAIGIFHEKVGLMYDDKDNIIAFSGSMNESANAFLNNYEAIDVFASWTQDRDRVLGKQAAFDSMWNDREPNIRVLEFPRINQAIIDRYRTTDRIELFFDDESSLNDRLGIETKINNGPFVPSDIHLRLYQVQAIKSWVNQNYQGIFDMATGERVIIVMGAVNVMKPRVSGTLNKYILCIA